MNKNLPSFEVYSRKLGVNYLETSKHLLLNTSPDINKYLRPIFIQIESKDKNAYARETLFYSISYSVTFISRNETVTSSQHNIYLRKICLILMQFLYDK